MNADPTALHELVEASQDYQADAMRTARGAMADLQAVGDERRAHPDRVDPVANQAFAAEHRRILQHSLAPTGALAMAGGGLLLGLLASPAYASESPDVQMLQTAASIENLAVSTYSTALTLPYIGGSAANPVVTKFCQVTKAQHAQHGDAFNAAARRLGGKAQKGADPTFVPVVKKAVASLSGASASAGAAGVVALAVELENVAAETYVHDVANLHDTQAKALTASIMGVEAQHVAVLRAVQALLEGGAPQLITLSPTNVASLPAAAGNVGFPDAFYPTSQAAPAKQGALK